MREEEFISIMNEAYIESFTNGIPGKSISGFGFSKDKDGMLSLYTVGKKIIYLSGEKNLEELEIRQARFDVNYRFENYHAAISHLMAVIDIRMVLMHKKYGR